MIRTPKNISYNELYPHPPALQVTQTVGCQTDNKAKINKRNPNAKNGHANIMVCSLWDTWRFDFSLGSKLFEINSREISRYLQDRFANPLSNYVFLIAKISSKSKKRFLGFFPGFYGLDVGLLSDWKI
jgi:hypothetical protein